MLVHYGRKRSGIKAGLNKKLNNWLMTITDEDLRSDIAKEIVVTGGAIASMLLGENVNDYDIYFKTLDMTKRVAQYYIDSIPETLYTTKPTIVVQDIQNIKGDTETRVQIYVESLGIFKQAKKKGSKYQLLCATQNALTLANKIQIIIRFYGEPTEIHDNFDFIHATCYYDYAEHKLVMPAAALESLLSRSLYYCGSLYPIASIFRVKKFLKRGWRITAGQQLKIMWQISEIILTDLGIMEEQLTGVDLVHMQSLIEALRATVNIDSTYVAKVIDQIFNEGMEEEV